LHEQLLLGVMIFDARCADHKTLVGVRDANGHARASNCNFADAALTAVSDSRYP
jgi:hypothetical protein